MAIVYEELRFDFPIRLRKIKGKRFEVQYGQQTKRGDYGQSCANLGEALMHALQIRGELD